MAETSRPTKDGQKGSKGKPKKPPAFTRKISDLNVSIKSPVSSDSSSPILPEWDDDTMAAFPSLEPRRHPLDLVICNICKQNVMRIHAKDHVTGCQQAKRRKKEARDATARAKEKAEKRGDKADDASDGEIRVDSKANGSGARKSTTKTSNGPNNSNNNNNAGGATSANDDPSKKSKKRKADAEEDKSEPKKKKNKKDEPKPKAVPKPKGPVDVEKQCGVVLPNGAQCARSLTCKSHSMGSKRAVPGRSLPYDMLLQAYQKKNQARQQKAAISANAPALYDSDPDDPSNVNGAPIDSDSERDAVMTSVARNFNLAYLHAAPVYNPTTSGHGAIRGPQPLATHIVFPTRRKYQLVRMKEMLSNALSGNRAGGMFAVQEPGQGTQSVRQGTLPGSAGGGGGGGVSGGGMTGNDGFAIPSSTISLPSTASSTAGDAMAEAQRRATAGNAGSGSAGALASGGGSKTVARRPSVVVAAGAD